MDNNFSGDEQEQLDDPEWREKSRWERHPIAEWGLHWYVSLMVLLTVWVVCRDTPWHGLTPWTWVVAGCYLSKKVLTPALGEGSYYNASDSPVSDRFRYRLKYLVFWPLAYPWLLLRLLFLKAN